MFEVGKKYKYMANQVVYNCIAADKTWAVLQFGEATPFVTQATGLYEEYKEPRTITHWVNIYKNRQGEITMGGVAWTNRDRAIAQTGCGEIIDTIPVSYTEPL